MTRDIKEIIFNYSLKTKVFIYSSDISDNNPILKEFSKIGNIYFGDLQEPPKTLNFLSNPRVNIFQTNKPVGNFELGLIESERFQICLFKVLTDKQLLHLKRRGYILYSWQQPFGTTLIISDFINGFPSAYLRQLNSHKLVDLISEPPENDYDRPR